MFYHNLYPNLVLGFHGCEKSVGLKLLNGKKFTASDNDYDWLGPGVYFWEANPDRARSFAEEKQKRGQIKEPFVIGAVLTLGNCIDTLNETSIIAINLAHRKLKSIFKARGQTLPTNRGGPDRVLKELDCAVISTLHDMIQEQGMPAADSLRGLYYEGKRIYPTSSFFEKSHTQICVVNEKCIKGVFRPR